jgi:hypothetical protein
VDEWTLTYEGYDPEDEGLREALCTLGNGVLATRGALPECRADGVHYPGTYRAGLFNRLADEVDGVEVTNESMVNLPNWLVLSSGRRRCLVPAVRGGTRRVPDRAGPATGGPDAAPVCGTRPRTAAAVTQRRIVHMVDPQLAALETTFGAEGFSGTLTVRSAIDTAVRNTGVERYRDLSDLHLDVITQRGGRRRVRRRGAETNQSHVRIAEAQRTRVVGRDGADGGRARRRGSRTTGSSATSSTSTLDDGAGHGREGRRDRRRRRSGDHRALRVGDPQGRARPASTSCSGRTWPSGTSCGTGSRCGSGSVEAITSSTCTPSTPCRRRPTTPSTGTSGSRRGAARRGLPGPHLLGRGLHPAVPEPADAGADPLAAALPLPTARGGAARARSGRPRRRDLPVAERLGRARGEPGDAPQPRVSGSGSRQLAAAAPHQPGDRLQRLAVRRDHRRSRLPALLRAGAHGRDRPVLRQHGDLRPTGGPLPHPRRHGPRRVPRRLPRPRRARASTTTPTPT